MPPRCARVRLPTSLAGQAVVLGTTVVLRMGCVAWVCNLRPLVPGLVSLWECLITDDSRCAQAFLQTNSDLRLFCPSKRIADLVSRSPGRNTSAFLYYFSRGPRPGDWLSNQQVRPSSLLSDADVPGNSFPRPIVLDSCATRSIDRER